MVMKIYTNKELIERFVSGELGGSSKNMGIIYDDNHNVTYLVGYYHAVYAKCVLSNGAITVFAEWHNFSCTSTKHINMIRHICKRVLSPKFLSDSSTYKEIYDNPTLDNILTWFGNI